MRSIVYSETGPASVLTLADAPVPEPGPGEVRVRIHRSGVNPTDWKSRAGERPGTPVQPAQTPNQDGSGVVDAVGEGVETAWTGLRVWVWEAAYLRAHGTAADYSVVPVGSVVTLPDSASFDLGAALPIPFMTAHRCLTVAEHGPRRLGPGALAGRHVLVAGGAGAVGNAAIQLARWSDATVITTVSTPAKGQLAAAAGADHIIEYTAQDVVEEVRKITPAGVDAVVEVAAAKNAGLDAQLLAHGGSIAIYASNPGEEMTVPIRPLMAPNARFQFVLVYTEPGAAKAQAIDDITAALADAAIDVGEHSGMPLHHFPLERTADAHTAVEQGAVGKVLIDVSD